MPRNFRGEALAAFFVVLLLALVGLSAWLLSTVNTQDAPITRTAVVGGGTESVDTIAVTRTTRQQVSVTPTAAPSATPTMVPTDTPTATDSPVPTVTVAIKQTDTVLASPTKEVIVVEDTATNTPTETPSDTPSPTATNTPTATHTPTRTPLPTVTFTPSVTPTVTPSVTQAPSDTPVATSVPVTAPCERPSGWSAYTVQRGNTLFSIARAVQSSVGELRTVNCIANADNITTGQVLFVPNAPNSPVRTGVPRMMSDAEARRVSGEGCGIAASSVVVPLAGQRLSGTFDVVGTATLPGFSYYRLEVRPDFATTYNFYARSETPVNNGLLGNINAGLFGPGLHYIRLTVVDDTGNFIEPCVIPVIFD
ncbi:MAG: LysM peptidoglycan-binding domain-containing protein [Chloroflexota bacterium]